MMRQSPVVIKLARDDTRERAVRFIRSSYREKFGTEPDDYYEHIFVALRNDEIVGTFASQPWRSGNLPRIARIHNFIWDLAPYAPRMEEVVELGRWITRKPGITAGLVYSAAIHALAERRRIGWCEHTEEVHRVALFLGLQFKKVSSMLDIERVCETDREFYRRNPSIAFYMIELAHIASALEEKVVSNRHIILE